MDSLVTNSDAERKPGSNSGNSVDPDISAEAMKRRFAAIDAELERLGLELSEERKRIRELLATLAEERP